MLSEQFNIARPDDMQGERLSTLEAFFPRKGGVTAFVPEDCSQGSASRGCKLLRKDRSRNRDSSRVIRSGVFLQASEPNTVRRIEQQEAWTPLDYCHEDLRLQTSSDIRLLKILPSSSFDHLDCLLPVANLDAELLPDYICLSYTWDSPFSPNSCEAVEDDRVSLLTVNGCPVQPRPNLMQALTSLYRHGSLYPGCLVWADAICINQSDIAERSSQVQLMHRVFQQATVTLAWLGPKTADTDLAVELVRRLAYAHESVDHHELVALQFCHFLDPGSYAKLGMEALSEEHWKAIARLMSRTWFSRIWTFQEAVLSHHLLLVCGSTVVHYTKISRTLSFLALTRWTDQFNVQAWDLDIRPFLQPTVSYCRTKFHQSGFLDTQIVQACVADFLRTFHNAHDPRDFIYGLLGCASDGLRAQIAVDYSKPVEQVYMEATRAFIKMTGTLDILSRTDDPQLRKRSGRALPSWVTDFASHPNAVRYLDLIHPDRFSSAAESKAEIMDRTNTHVLSVNGYCLSVIDDEMLQVTRQCREQWPSYWGVMVYMIMLHNLADRNPSSTENMCSAVWRTAILSTGSLTSNQPFCDQNSFRCWLLWTLADIFRAHPLAQDQLCVLISDVASRYTSALVPSLDDVLDLCASLSAPTDNSDLRINTIRWHAVFFYNRQAVGNYLSDTPKKKEDEDEDEEGDQDLLSMGVIHSLYLLSDGSPMLASTSIEAGDEIWILHGSRVPMVLRPQSQQQHQSTDGNATYSVVCPAYVYGVMQGETFAENVSRSRWVDLI